MNGTSDKENLILNRIYQKLHYNACVSKGEDTFYIVEIFGIALDMQEKVKDEILDLEEEIFPEMDFLILPLVYTREEALKYSSDKYAKSMYEMASKLRQDSGYKFAAITQPPSPENEIALDYAAA